MILHHSSIRSFLMLSQRDRNPFHHPLSSLPFFSVVAAAAAGAEATESIMYSLMVVLEPKLNFSHCSNSQNINLFILLLLFRGGSSCKLAWILNVLLDGSSVLELIFNHCSINQKILDSVVAMLCGAEAVVRLLMPKQTEPKLATPAKKFSLKPSRLMVKM